MKLELVSSFNDKLPKNFAKINIEYNDSKDEIKELIEYIEKFNESIFLKTNYILEEILLKDIICFYSENKNNYCQVKNKIYQIKSRLYEIEKLSTDFMRISKNCIVNINHIENFDVSKTGSIKINLDNGSFRIVSRRKIRDVIDFLDERMKWFMKKSIFFILAFFIFYSIYTCMEYFIVNCLGMKLVLKELLKECFFQCIAYYVLIIVIIFIVNYIFTIFIAKKLNIKINLLKEERGKNKDEK